MENIGAFSRKQAIQSSRAPYPVQIDRLLDAAFNSIDVPTAITESAITEAIAHNPSMVRRQLLDDPKYHTASCAVHIIDSRILSETGQAALTDFLAGNPTFLAGLLDKEYVHDGKTIDNPYVEMLISLLTDEKHGAIAEKGLNHIFSLKPENIRYITPIITKLSSAHFKKAEQKSLVADRHIRILNAFLKKNFALINAYVDDPSIELFDKCNLLATALYGLNHNLYDGDLPVWIYPRLNRLLEMMNTYTLKENNFAIFLRDLGESLNTITFPQTHTHVANLLIDSKTALSRKYALISPLVEGMVKAEHRRIPLVLSLLFQRIGFSETELQDYLLPKLQNKDLNYDEGNLKDIITEDLATMVQIEEKFPHGAHILYDEYGIKNLGRYPIELLLDQLRSKDDHVRKPGVLEFADYDYTPAKRADHTHPKPSLYSRKNDLKNLHDNMKQKFALRVYEVRNPKAALESLIKSDVRYGLSCFTYANAHGNQSGMSLNATGKQADDFTVDLVKRFSSKKRRLTKPGSPFILCSCSTGKTDALHPANIARELSRLTQSVVIAPITDVGSPAFEFDEGKDRLKDVTYTDENLKTSPFVWYLDGEVMTPPLEGILL
jgi:hypothetical protein